MRTIDLTFGNPSFIQELIQDSYGGYVSGANSDYNLTTAAPQLKEAIYALHESVGNVKNPRDYQIVIGNGASQLLTAISKVVKVGVYAPFWSRFNNLIDDMQLFTLEWPHNQKTHNLLVTYPNNPDGLLSNKVSEAFVVDASYHWPTYYRLDEKLRALDNDIILFSFSKMSGLSSARLGWALVKNTGIALNITNEVELATCGVNVLTQQVACEFIDDTLINLNSEDSLFKVARAILADRINQMSQFYPEHLFRKQRGMFFYINEPSDLFDKLGVKYYRGKPFGDSNDMLRINIGCSTKDFNELIARLSLWSVASNGV